MWKKGAEYGTLMHARYELLGNLLEMTRNHTTHIVCEKDFIEQAPCFPEKEFFVRFCKDYRFQLFAGKSIFWRTELLLFHELLHITGTIDAVLYDEKHDEYIIIDYKRQKGKLATDPIGKNMRTKPISELPQSSRGKCLPAYEMIRNNNGNKYAIQLCIYARLFEEIFQKRVRAMFLICVDSTKIETDSAKALDIVQIDRSKYTQCINQLFSARAEEILFKVKDLPLPELQRKLLDYIIPY